MSGETEGARVTVSLGGYARAWRAELDLERGVIVRSGDLARTGRERIPAERLARLRACVSRAHAGGDHIVREQFATGGVEFVLTLGGETVTLRYETEGGGHYPRVQALFNFIDP